MKPVSPFILLVTLAACGADGLPEAPTALSSSGSGITVTGCASAGVTMGAPRPMVPCAADCGAGGFCYIRA